MAELLVSVRSVREAADALAGGAVVIDVKEPSRGSLGRADDDTVAEVVRFVAGRRSVSAAMGELVERKLPFRVAGLSYAKWGLARCRGRPGWELDLAALRKQLRQVAPGCQLVAVAYADWRRADSPAPEEVCAFACEHRCGPFLLDTWSKDGTTLLDWLSLAELDRLCRRCRAAGVPVALAGALGHTQIALLRALDPDWFAARGSVCHQGIREQSIDSGAVRRLVQLLEEESRSPLPEVNRRNR